MRRRTKLWQEEVMAMASRLSVIFTLIPDTQGTWHWAQLHSYKPGWCVGAAELDYSHNMWRWGKFVSKCPKYLIQCREEERRTGFLCCCRCYSLCVCVCVFVFTRLCMGLSRPEADIDYVLQLPIILFFETRYLPVPGACSPG